MTQEATGVGLLSIPYGAPTEGPGAEAMEGYLDEEARAEGHKEEIGYKKMKYKSLRNIGGNSEVEKEVGRGLVSAWANIDSES